MVLLIGALPALVGTTVLSSITASDLRKKSEELSDEIKNVLLKVQKIENILNKEKDKWGIFSKEVDEFEKRDKEKG
jgi:hypothetical protein